MTVETQNSQVQQPEQEKQNSKEYNFRALEAKLAQERSEKLELQRQLQERIKPAIIEEDDDTDSEPYVDYKKLNKKLAKHSEQIKTSTQSDIDRAVNMALQKKDQEDWLDRNPDFYETLNYAEKLAEKEPELAKSILRMPEGFERQKLVYKNIKALGFHKPEQKPQSIQEKVDSNRRSPYYQPSGIATAPYAPVSDFSQTGQKNAYQKMQELKNNLRI